MVDIRTEPIQGQDLQGQVQSLEKQMKALQKMMRGYRDYYTELGGPSMKNLFDKSPDLYNDRDMQILDMNPQLRQILNEVNTHKKTLSMLEGEKLNVEKAGQEMFGAMDQAEGFAKSSAEIGLGSIAQQQDMQLGAAQGLAGKAGATTGTLAKAQSEISNQFAPQRADVVGSLQQQMLGIQQARSDIPAKLQAMQSQNQQMGLQERQMSLAERQDQRAAAANKKNTPVTPPVVKNDNLVGTPKDNVK